MEKAGLKKEVGEGLLITTEIIGNVIGKDVASCHSDSTKEWENLIIIRLDIPELHDVMAFLERKLPGSMASSEFLL